MLAYQPNFIYGSTEKSDFDELATLVRSKKYAEQELAFDITEFKVIQLVVDYFLRFNKDFKNFCESEEMVKFQNPST